VGRLGPQQKPAQARCRSLAEDGEEIVSLSHSELEKIPLDEELAEAVELGRKLKPKKDESFRRHLQFIGRLMRSRDVEPIVEALSIIKNRHSTVNARLHRLEQWRERLITEGDSALNELMSQFHELDRQKLRQLIRTANKERELNKPPVAYREMYQYLRGEIEDLL
jgi:ribosome-associated protein